MTLQDKIQALIAHYGKAEAARQIGVNWVTVHRWTKGVKPLRIIEPLINQAYKRIKQ